MRGDVSKRWYARLAPALSSYRWIPWGGLALVVGGVLGAAAQVAFLLMFGVFPAMASGFAYGLLDAVFLLQGSLPLLVAAGLVGLYVLVTRRPGRFAGISGVGLAILLVSAVVLVGANLYDTLLAPRYIAYGPSQGVPVSQRMAVWAGWGWPIGAALLGVGVLGARGLARWWALPLALGLLSAPPFSYLFYYALTGGNPGASVDGISPLVLGAQPVLSNLGWVLLGYLMLRAGDLETVSQANERLARRLYEEAWGRGEVGALDEVVAPDVVDHYHGGQRGLESFKRNVSNLRVSFPDLRFDIEGQEAEGDRVTTRWTASGTDLGGVLWYPPTGRAATFSGTFVDRFEEGRLVEHRGEADTEGLLRRLGLPPKG